MFKRLQVKVRSLWRSNTRSPVYGSRTPLLNLRGKPAAKKRGQRLIFRIHVIRLARFAGVGLLIGGTLGYVNSLILDTDLSAHLIGGFGAGLMAGISIGLFELGFVSRRRPTSRLAVRLTLRVVGYSAILALGIVLANAYRFSTDPGTQGMEAVSLYLLQGTFVRDFILVAAVSVILVGVLQAGQLHRWRDVFSFVLGRYHRPKEVELVFMFLDLTSSTRIAAELGDLKYSAFLQDFFYDLNLAVMKWRGDVYQYVGDEIVVTWPLDVGVKQGRCIECFLAAQEEIRSRREDYTQRYGICPEFRGGLHGGTGVVTWVGEMRKTIVYHGDVLNTTARVLEHCKDSGYDLVITQELLNQTDVPSHIALSDLGHVSLRGKDHPIHLFGLAGAQPSRWLAPDSASG